VFLDRGLTDEETEKALEPMISFRAQLEDEVSWYERVRRRDFGVLENLSALGTTLIALRIANGYSQKELADRMGVSEAQVSRDERNEYHGITVERAQKVLDAMGETLESRVEDKPLTPA
jgi:DNA-binding XRE family transcriptional regulator